MGSLRSSATRAFVRATWAARAFVLASCIFSARVARTPVARFFARAACAARAFVLAACTFGLLAGFCGDVGGAPESSDDATMGGVPESLTTTPLTGAAVVPGTGTPTLTVELSSPAGKGLG